MTPPSVSVVAATHPGRLRSVNEDCLGASRWSAQGTVPLACHRYSGPDPVVCVVADGVGGQRSGDIASALVVDKLVHGAAPATTEELAEAVAAAHELVLEEGSRTPGRAGMATTVAILVVTTDTILCANVGDSRIYELSSGSAVQLSMDDTLAGDGAPPSSATAGVITQALGGARGGAIVPHTQWYVREPELTFLICSDGLTAVISDEEIGAVVDSTAPLGAAAGRLLDMALERDAPDNVSVLVVHTC